MFTKEEIGKQNLASKAMAAVTQESKSPQKFHTQHLDFPTSRLNAQKVWEWESTSENQMKPQENQSFHEVDEFREENWKQLEREGFCPRREFRYSDRGQTRGLGRVLQLTNQAKRLGTVSQEQDKTQHPTRGKVQNCTNYQGQLDLG